MLLNENNFLIFAAKHYINPNCISTDEFLEDLNRFKYLKKLFSTYKKRNELKERLILNHFIILYNVFEARALTRMLFYKLHDYKDCVKPFVEFLNYLGETIENEDGIFINTKTIPEDQTIKEKLRDI